MCVFVNQSHMITYIGDWPRENEKLPAVIPYGILENHRIFEFNDDIAIILS